MGDLAVFAPIAQLGASAVLLTMTGWLLRAIARGDWVSRRELDYVRADRDARLAEKDHEINEWRAVAATERTGREVVTDQNRDLVSGFRTLDKFYDGFRQASSGGGPHVDLGT